MLSKEEKVEKQNEMLKRIQDFRYSQKKQFSKEKKPLRLTYCEGKLKNVATTISKDVYDELVKNNCGSNFWSQQLMTADDGSLAIVFISGCQPIKSEPKWMKDFERHFSIKI